MSSNKDRIYELLDNIQALVKNNEAEDGTFHFDEFRVMVALDFAKTEIEKAVTASEWGHFSWMYICQWCETEKKRKSSVLHDRFCWRREGEPDWSQQNRAASSSSRFCLGVFQPKTDIGILLDLPKYRFIWSCKSAYE